jgi:hypothetical protein
VPFYRFGRGQYRAAIAFMAARTEGDVITVSSDHDFRNGMVLRYYATGLRGHGHVRYIEAADTAGHPEWLLVHNLESPPKAPRCRGDYALERVFPFYGLSGWNWIVYHRRSVVPK